MVTATAADLARCDYCATDRPAGELYAPMPSLLRCRDEARCRARATFAGTGTLPDFAIPETVVSTPAPAGTACALCGAACPGADLYERVPSSSQWFCRDRPACDHRTAMDMAPVRENFTDFVITSAQMRHMNAAARPQVPEERPAPDPVAMRHLAAADLLLQAHSARRHSG